jgi:hypothetical protein
MEVAEQIRNVSTRSLPTGVEIFVVELSNGHQYTTRDRSLGQLAGSNIGQTAHIEFDQQQKGQYTNRYINTLTVLESSPPEAKPAGLFDNAEPEPAAGGVVATDKDLQIAKSVALKAGVDILEFLPAEQRTVANVVIAAEFFTQWLVSWRP